MRAAKRAALRRLGPSSRAFDESRLAAAPLPASVFDLPVKPSVLQDMIGGLREGMVPHAGAALRILAAVHAMLRGIPNGHAMRVGPGERLTVVGDIHGHLDSLFFILQCNGAPSPTNKYVFNGDLVDRGPASVEVVLAIMGLMLLHGPGQVSLGRGNHESADQNQMYCGTGGLHGHDMGFHLDCDYKYGHEDGAVVYGACVEVFNSLPLFHTLHAPASGRKAFVVHGGLFMEPCVTEAMLQRIHRFRPIPVGGTSLDDRLFVQAMWADPRDMRGASMNESRGDIPCVFGESVTRDFCERNGFEMVVRSHEAEMEGHRRWHGGRLVTIFSASGYMNVRSGRRYRANKGAIIVFNEELGSRVDTFTAPSMDVTHPRVVDVAALGADPATDRAAADLAWAARRDAREACVESDLEFSALQAGLAVAGADALGPMMGRSGASGRRPAAASAVKPPPPPARRSAVAGMTAGAAAAGAAAEVPATSAAAAAARLRRPHPLTEEEEVIAAESAEAKAAASAERDWRAARETVVDVVIERKTDLYWCFSSADVANTGRVSLDQWCSGMKQCMPFDAPSWRHINAEFCLADVEADESVNYCRFLDRYVGDISPNRRSAQQEIMRSVARRLFEAVSEPTVDAIFRELDSNGDGVIDFHEFVTGLERVGVGLNRNQLVLLMHAIDSSMDGTISMQELESTFKVSFAPATEQGRAAAAGMDADTAHCLQRIGRLIIKAGTALDDLFHSIDADGSGNLSYDEFSTVLSELRLRPKLSPAQIEAVCKVVDADGSGSIELAEFRGAFSVEFTAATMDSPGAAAMAAHGSAAASRRASVPMLRVGRRNRIDFLSAIFSDIAIRFKAAAGQLGVAFHTFDTDGDGVLTRDEFHVALTTIGLDLEPEVLGAVIEAMDTDGDGGLNVREFIAALSSRDTHRGVDEGMPAAAGRSMSMFGGHGR